MQIANRIARSLIYITMLFGPSLLIAHAQSDMAAKSATADSVSTSSATPAATPKIKIGPGDLLQLTIFDVPELAQTVRVDDVGDVSLNLVGRIHLADLTVAQAQTLVAQKYASGHFLINPQVSILIHEYVTQGVSVFGEVTHPGVYQVLGKRTVFDVLSEAGGITQFAGNKVSIQRAADGSVQTVTLSEQGTTSLSSDVILQPGDKVVVPRAGIVYVIGDVTRPGGYVMQNDGHLSLLQAISMAMGTRSTASLNKTKLIRKSENGYVETPVALKKVLNGNEPDQQLHADDILYVPNSAGKSILYRGVPGVAQAASSAAIYHTAY
jgi:polysaccharide biosynthesis/export protein